MLRLPTLVWLVNGSNEISKLLDDETGLSAIIVSIAAAHNYLLLYNSTFAYIRHRMLLMLLLACTIYCPCTKQIYAITTPSHWTMHNVCSYLLREFEITKDFNLFAKNVSLIEMNSFMLCTAMLSTSFTGFNQVPCTNKAVLILLLHSCIFVC